MHLFHYHLVTSRVRDVEARYIAKLGFALVARYGRIGEEQVQHGPGVSWEELDRAGFKLRLSELERGSVNVVVQPGQWELPRVDHIGLVLDDDEFEDVLVRAAQLELRIQEYPGRRMFVATGTGYRLEINPPREWTEDLLAGGSELRLTELQLRSDEPHDDAAALAKLVDTATENGDVALGESVVRFLPGGPTGRPELYGELFG